MTDYPEEIPPSVALLATHLRHVNHLQELLQLVTHELERRALVHDRSKLSPEELPGFVRINATARQHAFGSPEYRASINAERPTVDRHVTGNSHHPEAHVPIETMGWIDIVEMVADWRAANLTYGGTTAWRDSLEMQRKRFAWTEAQWWLIEQVASFSVLGDRE